MLERVEPRLEGAENLPSLQLGDSEAVEVGGLVLAINGRLVETSADFAEITRQAARAWRVDFLRDGRRFALRLAG